jgi:two-component system NtrC family sensor kinase
MDATLNRLSIAPQTDREWPIDDSQIMEVLLAATLDGVIDWNLRAQRARYSARWKMMLGFEPDELVDSVDLWKTLTHPDDLPQFQGVLDDHIQHFWPLDHLARMRHRDGGWRRIHVGGSAIRDDGGQATRLILVCGDVTRRTEVEDQHRALAIALQAAGEGIYGLDLSGNLTFVNQAAADMLGWSTRELMGRCEHEIFHHSTINQEPYPAHDCPILSTLKTGARHKGTSDTFWRKDRTPFPVEYVSVPICEGSAVTGAVVTFRDLTQQRSLETQLIAAHKLESIGQLAAGVAHEINTPMQYIGDNLHFLKQAFTDVFGLLNCYNVVLAQNGPSALSATWLQAVDQARQDADLDYLLTAVPSALEGASGGVTAVSSIVRALKAFSHPGGKEKELADINAALQNTATIARNEWKYVAEVRTDFDPDLPRIQCFLGELNQVFLNVIVNAAQAMAEDPNRDESKKGEIFIQTRRADDHIEVRIKDSGPGIPEAVRHRIFDPFFTTKEVGKGTGQGLSVARSIVVKKHSGAIEVESASSQGTTFLIRLPVADRDADAR